MITQTIDLTYNGQGQPLTLSSYELGTTADQSVTEFHTTVAEGDVYDLVFEVPMNYLLCGKQTTPFIRFEDGYAVVPGAIMSRINDDHVLIYLKITHPDDTTEASGKTQMHVVTLDNTPVEPTTTGLLLIRGSSMQWRSDVNYSVDAFVTYDGTSYVSLADDNAGHTPSDDNWWRSMQGETGPEGPAGPEGPQGGPGEKGDPGVGFPSGGSVGDVLVKASSQDYDTSWRHLNAGDIIETTDRKIMTADERTKLSSVESGAEENVIEGITVNGTPIVPVGKVVDISVEEDVETTDHKSTSFAQDFSDDTEYPSSKSVKSFVNSSIQTATSFFDGAWQTYASIPTTAQGFVAEGLPVPGPNNYLVVYEDEEHDDQTWRYKYTRAEGEEYSKDGWNAEYKVNDTPLTDAQLLAINSGITEGKRIAYDGYALAKQDALDSSQMSAVNSGITSAKVTTYDGYASGKVDVSDMETGDTLTDSTSKFPSSHTVIEAIQSAIGDAMEASY